jgi:hypothetical protein
MFTCLPGVLLSIGGGSINPRLLDEGVSTGSAAIPLVVVICRRRFVQGGGSRHRNELPLLIHVFPEGHC